MSRWRPSTDGPRPEIEFLHGTDEPARERHDAVVHGSDRRRTGALLGGGLVAAALTVVAVSGGGEPVASPTTTTAPPPTTSSTLVDPAPVPPTLSLPSFDEGGVPLLIGPADRNTFFTQPYAIVRVRDDDRTHRVTLGLNGIVTTPLEVSSSTGLDRSGRFEALLTVQGALLAGPVGGDLVTLATDVASFSWHDQEPGRLAFITVTSTDDAPDTEPVRHEFRVGMTAEAVLPSRPGAASQLVAFGDWGDAFRLEDDLTRLRLGGPDGVGTLDIEGRVLGGLGDSVLIARPRPGGTTRVPDDAVQEVRFVDGSAVASSTTTDAVVVEHLRRSNEVDLTASLLAEASGTWRIEVRDPDAALVLTIPDVAGAEFDFSVDGISLAFLSTTPDLPLGLANLATGEIRRYAAPVSAGTDEAALVVGVRVE